MSFPRYAEYKDSGVEWLGEVPATWEAWKLRHAFGSIGSGTTPPSDEPQWYEEGTIPWITTGELRENVVTETMKSVTSEALAKYSALRLHPVGSLAVAMYGATIGRLGVLGIPATTNQACCVLSLPRSLNVQFLFYWLSGFKQNVIDLYATGGGQPNINQDTIASLRIPAPSMYEQAEIATFLDHETAKIDALVTEQEKLIALLKEKRQVVISHAVTKGLNPDAPMKDSGIEWLGKVPAHWTVMPIRIAAKLESGHTPSRSHPEYWEDCSVPWFTLGDVWQIRDGKTDHVYETKELVSEIGLANSSARLLPAGTVMLSRTASVGFTAIMGVDMATTQDFANWICGPSLRPEFLLYVLRAMQGEFRRLMMGSTHNTIYMPDIQAFRFALPTLNEQQTIVEKLRSVLAQLDELNTEAEKGIVLLKERRSALISAAVTGKIDVREFA